MKILIFCPALGLTSGSGIRARLLGDGLKRAGGDIAVVSSGIPSDWSCDDIRLFNLEPGQIWQESLLSAAQSFSPDFIYGITEAGADAVRMVAEKLSCHAALDLHGLGFIEVLELGAGYGPRLPRVMASLKWLWAQLAGCVECCEAIRATYQTFDGRTSEYELHPYHLLAYHGNWYAKAMNTAKARVETFALSRFRRVEGTGGRFTRPTDFSPEKYARQAFGIVGGETPMKVRLLFEPKLTIYITERQWHPSQEFRTHPDGRVEMRLETTRRKELVRWILSWMPDVKVLAPKSLHDRIAEKLQDGLLAQE